MKLPVSLGVMGTRAATSELEMSFDTTKKRTRAHAERFERNLTGKREYPDEVNEHDGHDMWDGTHNMKHDFGAQATTGPFKWDLVNASKEHGFSVSISRTLKHTRSSVRTNSGRN